MRRAMTTAAGLMLCALLVGTTAEAADTGTIAGKIDYTGRQGRLRKIQMSADPQCEKLHAGKEVFQEVVTINDNGTLGNVFVHIKEGLAAGVKGPEVKPVIDQQGCIYHPRVQGGMVGGTLLVRNSDPTLHNIHAWSTKRNSFNVAQPTQGLEDEFDLKDEEVMLKVKCDVHPWMLGWVGVLPHGFSAVSDEQGAFKIEGVPPGRYVLQAWQETFGALTQEVEVKAGETANVDFVFAGRQKASLEGFKVQELHPDAYAAEIRLTYRERERSARP